ncbi:hypothetical protein D3C87_2041460 [compost metagenome]
MLRKGLPFLLGEMRGCRLEDAARQTFQLRFVRPAIRFDRYLYVEFRHEFRCPA